jgi:hypothetical protein
MGAPGFVLPLSVREAAETAKRLNAEAHHARRERIRQTAERATTLAAFQAAAKPPSRIGARAIHERRNASAAAPPVTIASPPPPEPARTQARSFADLVSAYWGGEAAQRPSEALLVPTTARGGRP